MNGLLTCVEERLATVCGAKNVLTDPEDIYSYGKDETLNLHFPFDVLVKPGSAQEVAAVLNICNEYGIAVTPRGGGSGVTGGALPARRGVVLSLERLNRIIEVNKLDRYVIAESGVITSDLSHAVEASGLYFPVLPSSSGFSFVGGNIAENAGSLNSCKYGSTGRYVLNLEVALSNGEVIWTGANVEKNATGLNLTQLFVGSEGVLGVITKVVYRLIPRPPAETWLLAGFHSVRDAFDAVMAFRQSDIAPSATELICGNALKLTAAYLNEPLPLVKDGIGAHLLIGVEEPEPAANPDHAVRITEILEKYTTEEVLVAYDTGGKERLQKLRFGIGAALKARGGYYRDIDICISLSILYDYVREVEDICSRHDVPMACFGHVLSGNLHVMLRVSEDAAVASKVGFDQAVQEIYAFALRNGGVISGEHGVGLLQKDFMGLQFSEVQLRLMRKIKELFDPKGILNPGKIFNT